jgi:hypothetical protein
MAPWHFVGRACRPVRVLYPLEGGVAFLWGSTALLIVAHDRTSRRALVGAAGDCAAFSFVITGTIGLGWMAAVPFAAINLGEAVIAATLMRKRPDSGELMAACPGSADSWSRQPPRQSLMAPSPPGAVDDWRRSRSDAGRLRLGARAWQHDAGADRLHPDRKAARQETRRLLVRKWRDALIVFPIVICVTVLVFWQTTWPLLFLPVHGGGAGDLQTGPDGCRRVAGTAVDHRRYMTTQGFGPDPPECDPDRGPADLLSILSGLHRADSVADRRRS